MAKKDLPAIKKILFAFLCLVVLYIFLGSYKGIYNNLLTMPAVQLGLYNPVMDLIIAALSSIIYWFCIRLFIQKQEMIHSYYCFN